MVVSVNPEPNKAEFETLLENTLLTLRKESAKNVERYSKLLGSKLEQEVVDVLKVNAVGTPFDGSIELISGQRFPDIVANGFYGIEVKTTKSNYWKSTGSSVAEGTRVAGVERIFMLFGKMCDPIEFMCRSYEDCLSEVVVTHSPRYLIDMNLKKGETIFDKIQVPYDELRRQPNPIETVLAYYKAKLQPGESTWWSGEDTSRGTNMIIRLWNNLDSDERLYYVLKGYCLFPELLSKRTDKFNRFALWLSMREGVVCPNVRDMFTSGGQDSIIFNKKTYYNIPRIVVNLTNYLDEIKSILTEIDVEELEKYWGYKVKSIGLYEQWSELVAANANIINEVKFPFKLYLNTM